MKLLAPLFLAAMLAAPALPSFAADAAPAAAAPAAPDLVKGAASFATCAACHGANGNSIIGANPKLAQQHPEYLIKQLQDFKSGKRANAIMSGMAATLSDDDMRNIAYWLASNKETQGFATDKALVATGEHIYRGGNSSRHIPACAGCHSPNGAGIPSQYPRLSGQQEDYIAAQLTAFRDGTRKNSVPMAEVAANLNDHEIKALADYIAGLR
ncbi:MAG: cytochrome c4 [Burkholderiaceae bacterium]|nr:MAG: cytochrome c4 [Burkholderiaceae bacterium]